MNNDETTQSDELMRSLGRLARDDQRWQKLSDGTLPAAERAELESQAAEDAELARAYDAYRPLSDEIRGRIVERARLSIGNRKKETTACPAEEDDIPVKQAPRKHLVRRAAPVVAALAACLLLVFWPAANLAPLPPFELEQSGGLSSVRSSTTSEVYTAEQEIRLLLRPATAVEGELEAALFADLGRGLELQKGPEPRISDAGNVLYAGRLMDLLPGVAAGDVEIWLVAGRPGQLPTAADLSELGASSANTENWSALSTTLTLAEVP